MYEVSWYTATTAGLSAIEYNATSCHSNVHRMYSLGILQQVPIEIHSICNL